MWDKGWDEIFESNEWGRYPPEELIRFVAKYFYKADKRFEVKILEVGCGTGANIWYLSKEGFDVYGIDGSANGIERSKKRLNEEMLHANLRVGDIIELPYKDNFFDCVVDNECIYSNSYADSKKILSEINRVLKNGGKFYSKTFMTGTYGDGKGEKLIGEKNTYTKIGEGALRQDYGIIRFMDENEIPDLYSAFEIESIDYIIRSAKNQSFEVKEWIVDCTKL